MHHLVSLMFPELSRIIIKCFMFNLYLLQAEVGSKCPGELFLQSSSTSSFLASPLSAPNQWWMNWERGGAFSEKGLSSVGETNENHRTSANIRLIGTLEMTRAVVLTPEHASGFHGGLVNTQAPSPEFLTHVWDRTWESSFLMTSRWCFISSHLEAHQTSIISSSYKQKTKAQSV